MSWFIDDSAITVTPKGMWALHITVDDSAVAEIPNSVHGRFAIPWKKRDVELRRLGPSRGLESALYIDDVLVPPATEGPARGERAKCGAHGKATTRLCPGCDAVMCRECLSVDGVRCDTCLEAAQGSARTLHRRSWFIGALFCLAVAIACALGAAATGNDFLPKAAGTMLFGAAFMAYAGMRKHDSGSSAKVHPAFEVSDEPPQLAGARCRACKERIGTAKLGHFCTTCRRVMHQACADDHACKLPARGPDWEAMRNPQA